MAASSNDTLSARGVPLGHSDTPKTTMLNFLSLETEALEDDWTGGVGGYDVALPPGAKDGTGQPELLPTLTLLNITAFESNGWLLTAGGETRFEATPAPVIVDFKSANSLDRETTMARNSLISDA